TDIRNWDEYVTGRKKRLGFDDVGLWFSLLVKIFAKFCFNRINRRKNKTTLQGSPMKLQRLPKPDGEYPCLLNLCYPYLHWLRFLSF
ncbi:hypothetical protein ACQUW2_02920, partial [Enterobacter hormaechei]